MSERETNSKFKENNLPLKPHFGNLAQWLNSSILSVIVGNASQRELANLLYSAKAFPTIQMLGFKYLNVLIVDLLRESKHDFAK